MSKVASVTAANVVINDALARSASKRYTPDGKLLRGKKEQWFTKEDAIQSGISVIPLAIGYANAISNLKMVRASRERAKNEAMVNKWGQNILTDKIDNVIWQSPDFMTAIIDKR